MKELNKILSRSNFNIIKVIVMSCFVNLLLVTDCLAQDTIQQWEHSTHLKLVQIEQGNSYFTTPWDIGNIEDLKMEINSNASFILRENDKAHLMMVFTPQIIIRMFNTRSYPVKTPSYMPHVSLFYSFGEISHKNMNSLFLRFGHHSNGQRGPTYLENGDINLETGDFSTNYFELGGIYAFYNNYINKIFFYESSFEYHLKEFTQPAILGKYGLYRWNNKFSILSSPKFFSNKEHFQMDAKFNWMFGSINDWTALNYKRLGIELTLFYNPKFLAELGFFIKYYQGMDYYNIYFDHHLTVLRFGIMTQFLRF